MLLFSGSESPLEGPQYLRNRLALIEIEFGGTLPVREKGRRDRGGAWANAKTNFAFKSHGLLISPVYTALLRRGCWASLKI